jgi:hypothetical protein
MWNRCIRSLVCVFGCWIAAKKFTAHRLAQSTSSFTVCAASNEFVEPRGALEQWLRRPVP